MKRCKVVHDVTNWPYKILRCEREEGHSGNHKPKHYEPISKAMYDALARRLRRQAS